jgi:hypothetical protein
MSDLLPPPAEDPQAQPVAPEPAAEPTVEPVADATPDAAGWPAPEPIQPAPGYVPPPAYPAAPAPDAAAPPTWPAAYPAAPMPVYASEPVPVYAAPAPASQTSSNAVVALILAVVSWAVCPIIPAIVALVFASNATKEINASGGRVQGQGLVTAAKIVSWINIGLWAAVLVVGVFFIALVAVTSGINEPNGF